MSGPVAMGAGESTVDPRVSVVIPTHLSHRFDQLARAVESVLAQDPRPARVVVAVDHNDELLARARGELTGATVVANAAPRGASGNRNTGIGYTDTPLIALLDDDATARPGWLAGLVGALAEDDVLGAGGAIVPRWQSPRPDWFPDELLWAVAARPERTDGPATVRNVWSASMALRRSAFEAAGGFRVGFAPRGDGTGLEDTDLCLRMARMTGGRWVYVPDAVVDHAVPVERATVRYLVTRCFREGRGKVAMARLLGGHGVLDLERRYLGRVVLGALRRDVVAAVRGRGRAHLARAGVLLLALGGAAAGAAAGALRRRAPHSFTPLTVAYESPVGVRE